MIATIALVVVGPQKLPGMLRTIGQWMRKLRRLTTEVRAQTGIDEILREEGIDGVHELRSLLRGEIRAARHQKRPVEDPYPKAVDFDSGREYPAEGVDVYHAVPDDLWQQEEANAPVDEGESASTHESKSVSTKSSTQSGGAKPVPPPRPTPTPSSSLPTQGKPAVPRPRPSKTS